MKATAISKTEGRILTLPNLLTLLRLLLLPACLYAYLGRESRVEATLILLLSGLTDILDGSQQFTAELTAQVKAFYSLYIL